MVEQGAQEIYRDAILSGITFVVTDLATAELAKILASAFFATKISFINAMTKVCESADANVTLPADAIGYDERNGRRFLNPAIGFEGGCLPKDIRGFIARASQLGANQVVELLTSVDRINTECRLNIVQMVESLVGQSHGARIAIWGTAFMPYSDHVRGSPALDIAEQLRSRGALLTAYDPKALANSESLLPEIRYETSAHSACEGTEVVRVRTEWDEFRQLEPATLDSAVKNRRLIDGRNFLDQETWRKAGWLYKGIGR